VQHERGPDGNTHRRLHHVAGKPFITVLLISPHAAENSNPTHDRTEKHTLLSLPTTHNNNNNNNNNTSVSSAYAACLRRDIQGRAAILRTDEEGFF
jgi:hypothetical protein